MNHSQIKDINESNYKRKIEGIFKEIDKTLREGQKTEKDDKKDINNSEIEVSDKEKEFLKNSIKNSQDIPEDLKEIDDNELEDLILFKNMFNHNNYLFNNQNNLSFIGSSASIVLINQNNIITIELGITKCFLFDKSGTIINYKNDIEEQNEKNKKEKKEKNDDKKKEEIDLEETDDGINKEDINNIVDYLTNLDFEKYSRDMEIKEALMVLKTKMDKDQEIKEKEKQIEKDKVTIIEDNNKTENDLQNNQQTLYDAKVINTIEEPKTKEIREIKEPKEIIDEHLLKRQILLFFLLFYTSLFLPSFLILVHLLFLLALLFLLFLLFLALQ